ncbi:MAG: response regulator [Agarilytica sp.]
MTFYEQVSGSFDEIYGETTVFRILVVDDSEINLELVRSCLEDEFDVVTLDSGKQCLASVGDISPDLILLDIRMPGLDGFSVCQALKASDDTAFIPVIFLTSLDQVSDRVEGYACGAEDYITKPFDKGELIRQINIALENAGKQKEWAQQYEINKENPGLEKSALEQLYEMSVLMGFHQKCTDFEDVVDLGYELVKVCRVLGLDGSLQMRTYAGMQYIGCRVDSLEAKLLAKEAKGEARSHPRNRLIFHNKNLSLLVKNMPQDNADKYNRVRDNIQLLINSASNRFEIIELEAREKAHQREGVQNLDNAIFFLEKTLNNQNREVRERLIERLRDTRNYVDALNLERGVEKGIVNHIEECLRQAEGIGSIGDISAIFNKMVRG